MTIMPTLNGGLKLCPEDETDWTVLQSIAMDAHDDLAARLAGLMDEESMWEDIVVPELDETFSGQLKLVAQAIQKAKKEDAEEVVISKEESESWYGALNQARLGIESKYHFGQNDELEESEIEDPETAGAYLRGGFYGAMQQLLLEYVMQD